jgi:Tfp pilus assembly major pilin PilA
MQLATPDIEALKSALVKNQGLAEWCTIAVFAGLVVEYTILLWLKRKDYSRNEIVLTVAAGLAIAGGVYGEYAFGSKVSEAAVKLENISEQRVADAQEKAGVANATAKKFESQISDSAARVKAAEAQVASANAASEHAVAQVASAKARIAEAEARASEARSVAEAERLERLKLEARVAPRTLTLEQQRLITGAMREFSGHPAVRVSSYGLDGEGAALGAQIISVLRSAGIPVHDERAQTIVTGGFENGIHLRGPVSDNTFLLSLYNALSSTGKLDVFVNGPSIRAGVTQGGSAMMGGNATIAGGGGMVNDPVPKTGSVSLMVGIKPVPVLLPR